MNQKQKRDYQLYYIEGGDPGFSPERNNEVVERTIKKYEKLRKKKQAKFQESVNERADALATYITSLKNGTPMERYFGKREMARLRGERVMKILKNNGAFELIEINN